MAPSSSSDRMARDALRLTRVSKYRPRVKNAISSAAVSKYSSRPPASRAQVEYPNAAGVPRLTRVSMFTDRARARCTAPARKGHPE